MLYSENFKIKIETDFYNRGVGVHIPHFCLKHITHFDPWKNTEMCADAEIMLCQHYNKQLYWKCIKIEWSQNFLLTLCEVGTYAKRVVSWNSRISIKLIRNENFRQNDNSPCLLQRPWLQKADKKQWLFYLFIIAIFEVHNMTKWEGGSKADL